MKIDIKSEGHQSTVLFIGDLDTLATTRQADELQKVLAIADQSLLIDCSQLQYISSAGLRFFLQLKRESEAKGGSVRFSRPSNDVADIFRLSGFENIFVIEK